MTVSTTLTMPDQPASGQMSYIPLGGDGMNAPHSAYSIFVTVAMDASGGNSQITMFFDERYTQMVSYMRTEVVGVAANASCRQFVRLDGDEICTSTEPALYWSGTALASALWKPPGVIVSSRDKSDAYMFSQLVNTDGDTHNFTARVYNFDKRARELTPISVLLASLPR